MMISVVIPNYNGVKLLKKNLPKILNNNIDEVIVVDDASSDDSAQGIKKFKEVKLVQNEKNLGFVKSVNKGVSLAKGEIIVLLNNDVTPSKNFLEPVIPYFERERKTSSAYFKNDKIFAVSFSEPQFSWAKAEFRDGFIVHSSGKRSNKPHISFWASGGSAAYSAEKWQSLGGMDEIYHPFYWEDIDLSYRAAKRGWEIWWEPASVVHHTHGETIEKYYSAAYIEYISARNQLILIWKNIVSEKMLAAHRKKLFKKLFRGEMIRPFLGALVKFPEILSRRKIEKLEAELRDEEIFAKFS